MTTAQKNIPAFARRYASAHVDLLAKKQYDAARAEATEFLELIDQSAELRALIKNPLFSDDSKIAVLQNISKKAKMSAELSRLIDTVAANGRLSALPKILHGIVSEISGRLGEVTAVVETPYELNKTQTSQLEKEIGKISGGKANMTVALRPDLIGGLVITIGSQRIDGSVKRRLELLAQKMRSDAKSEAA